MAQRSLTKLFPIASSPKPGEIDRLMSPPSSWLA
jgi:hypothetical protein